MSEERKGRSKEEHSQEYEKNAAIQNEYSIAVIDGQEEKIRNFRMEPPGLFQTCGNHPKQVLHFTELASSSINLGFLNPTSKLAQALGHSFLGQVTKHGGWVTKLVRVGALPWADGR